MGYASIAEEIEDPFGYDRNDFDMNHFCQGIIAKELAAVTSRPPLRVKEWIINGRSKSLGTGTDARTLAARGDPSEVRELLGLGSPKKSTFPSSSRSMPPPRNNVKK